MKKKKYKIDVKMIDIRKGKTASYDKCAVALALDRKCKNGYNGVTADQLTFNGIDVPTPARVTKFIERFDAGWPVKPFSFNIYIPL